MLFMYRSLCLDAANLKEGKMVNNLAKDGRHLEQTSGQNHVWAESSSDDFFIALNLVHVFLKNMTKQIDSTH